MKVARGPHPRPEIAGIVQIGAIDDFVDAAPVGFDSQAGKKLGLTEKAALMGIAGIPGVGQLHRFDHDVLGANFGGDRGGFRHLLRRVGT